MKRNYELPIHYNTENQTVLTFLAISSVDVQLSLFTRLLIKVRIMFKSPNYLIAIPQKRVTYVT